MMITKLKTDALREKMKKYVIEHIEKFIQPEFRSNKDAIRLACEWLEVGTPLYEINARLEVLEEEYIQNERAMILEEHEEVLELDMKEDAIRAGLGTIGDHNDTNYFHF